MIKVGIFGASGYAGGELLRYLVVHPKVELCYLISRSNAGKCVGEVFPNLASFCDLKFIDPEKAFGSKLLREIDCLFLALEHNASQKILPSIIEENPDLKVVDLAGDFRAKNSRLYQSYYGVPHTAPHLLERFVYGFTEGNREKIKNAQFVANPGCFATSLLLGLWPVYKSGKLKGVITATAITGSSGAGLKPKDTTHHPHRAVNVRAYKILEHQHLLEILDFLKGPSWRLLFVPQSGPFVRGIFATLFFAGIRKEELREIYLEAYRDSPLVDVIEGTPELRLVQNSPRSIVGFSGKGEDSVGLSALDNLGKGAATQAIQNFNLMFGFDETEGLRWPAGFV